MKELPMSGTEREGLRTGAELGDSIWVQASFTANDAGQVILGFERVPTATVIVINPNYDSWVLKKSENNSA